MRRARQTVEKARTNQIRWVTFLAIFLVSIAEALAQEQRNVRFQTPVEVPRQPSRRIIVSIPDHKLALIEDGLVVKFYPIAVGAKATPSPAGEFKIANRLTEPTYYAPGVVIGPGPENPLGTRWIGLSLRGFGIHGTNEPKSIGRRASHGCIRMHQADLEELFELVRIGDVVEMHGTRTVELAAMFAPPSVPAPNPAPAQPAPMPLVAAALTPH